MEQSTNTQWKSVFTEVLLYLDMIIFFLNAPLHSFPPPWSTADSSYIIIECLFSFLSLLSLCHTHWLPLTPSSPSPLSLAGVSPCENLIMFCYWTCKLNWTESYSPGLSQSACIVFMYECGCTCMRACLCVCRYLYVWSVVNKSGRAPSGWQCPGGEIFPFFRALGNCGSSMIWPGCW